MLLAAVGLVLADRVRQRRQHAARARRRRDSASWRCAPRSAPAARGSCASCSSEGLVLAVAGGALGVLMAGGRAARLPASAPTCCPCRSTSTCHVDGTVLAFALARVARHGGAVRPRARLVGSKPELVPALKARPEGDRRPARHAARRAGRRPARAVAGAARRGRAARARPAAARATDLGFDPRPVSSLSFNLQMNGYDEARARRSASARSQSSGAAGRERRVVASRLPLAPDINMEGIRVRATTSRRTSDTRSTPCEWAPTTSRPSACRSSRAARSRRTRSARGEGRGRQRDVGAAVLAGRLGASASASTPPASTRRRSRSSASPATTRCDRSASRRGPTCTCPRPSRQIACRPHGDAGQRRRCRCCARRCWSSSRTSCSPRTPPPSRSRRRRWRRRESARWCSARSARSRCCSPRSASTA